MRRALIILYKILFVRRAFFWLHRRLLIVSLWGLGILNAENARLSGEQHFIRHLTQFIPPCDNVVVFDVGANIGNYSRLIIAEHPSATVYAFEPHPTTYHQLVQNVAGLPVETYNFALSNVSGTATLFDMAGAASSYASLLQPVLTELRNYQTDMHSVVITTIDQFVQEHQIQRIDFLKIDAEGSEFAILQGAKQSISVGRIACIQFEFNEMNIISRSFFRDFVQLLPEYQFYRMLPDGLVPIKSIPAFVNEIFAFQNIVAIRKQA